MTLSLDESGDRSPNPYSFRGGRQSEGEAGSRNGADVTSEIASRDLGNLASAYYHKFAIVYGRQLLDRSLTVAARKAQ